jgi:hypothetical protein
VTDYAEVGIYVDVRVPGEGKADLYRKRRAITGPNVLGRAERIRQRWMGTSCRHSASYKVSDSHAKRPTVLFEKASFGIALRASSFSQGSTSVTVL